MMIKWFVVGEIATSNWKREEKSKTEMGDEWNYGEKQHKLGLLGDDVMGDFWWEFLRSFMQVCKKKNDLNYLK